MYSEKSKLHTRQKKHKPGNLRTLALDITAQCNMACPHCYADTFRNVEPVDLKILRKALDEAYDLGVYHYVLQGGEPIEDPERLEAILSMIYPDETYINIVTNGWGMTKEKIRWLKKLKVDKIAFSLDSGIESEHDKNRKPGSFQRVMIGIDNVLKEGLLTSISTVVTHTSLYSPGFHKAYELAKNRGIRIDVQIAEPVGKWDGKIEHLMTKEDTVYIKKLQIKSPMLSNGQRMVNRDIYSGEFDHCPAGTEFMGITVDGQVLPCNFLQYTLGNIQTNSIKEMRDLLLTSQWFDGKHPVCLCGENQNFIYKFILPYKNVQKPLNARDIFHLKESTKYD
jgi:MoaA/NifB/PqqE/SkfB family radical SAM enzyme